jgi:hypothetical protein
MEYYEKKLAEYKKMFEEAKSACKNGYRGYGGASALSMYVYDRFGVNVVCNNIAHDALCEIPED